MANPFYLKEIILGLSKAEKKNFTQFTKFQEVNEKYLFLYQLIESNKYSEDLIEEKYLSKYPLTRYSNDKAYLEKFIIKTLKWLHEEDEDIQGFAAISTATIFYIKKNKIILERYINKIASNDFSMPLTLQIINTIVKLNFFPQHMTQEALRALKTEKLIPMLKNYIKYYEINIVSNDLRTKRYEYDYLQEIQEDEHDYPFVKVSWNFMQSILAIKANNFPKSIFHLERNVILMNNYADTKSEQNYFSCLTGLVFAYLKNNDDTKVQDYINAMKEFKGTNLAFQQYCYYISTIRLFNYNRKHIEVERLIRTSAFEKDIYNMQFFFPIEYYSIMEQIVISKFYLLDFKFIKHFVSEIKNQTKISPETFYNFGLFNCFIAIYNNNILSLAVHLKYLKKQIKGSYYDNYTFHHQLIKCFNLLLKELEITETIIKKTSLLIESLNETYIVGVSYIGLSYKEAFIFALEGSQKGKN